MTLIRGLEKWAWVDQVDITPMSIPLYLPENEAHLWWVIPERITDSVLLDCYRGLMSAEESEQQRRFVFEKHRHEYLVARALVRTVLSGYTGVSPEKWRFRKNEYGRPEICEPALSAPIWFSLSHTDGCIICLCGREKTIGVDVEDIHRSVNSLELADRFFSAEEAAGLRILPETERQRHFFKLWTLKESFIKARGMGLSLALNTVTFRLERPDTVCAFFDASLEDDPGNWQFELFPPTDHHVIAAAVRRGRGANWNFRLIPTIPLSQSVDRPA